MRDDRNRARRRPMTGTIAGAASALLLACAQGVVSEPARAGVIYKDDTNPDGVPDFPQGNKCVCSRAAWTNSLWFMDGRKEGGKYKWPKLIDNTDETDRQKNWRADGIKNK